MNDRLLYDLLFSYIDKGLKNHSFTLDLALVEPEMIWDLFTSSMFLKDNLKEIQHLVTSIAKELDRKERLTCQYCRIEEGFFVEPPVVSEDLCKRHRQEYEERYVDRTLTQEAFKMQSAGLISPIEGKEGVPCAPPHRKRSCTTIP